MSGAQTSPFPNQNELMQANAQQLANYYAPERNRLFIEDAKQQIAGRETEMMARASQGLLTLGDEAKMAAAYPETVRYLQSQGFAKNAPAAFPGKAVLERMVSFGIPAEKQYTLAGDQSAKTALWPGGTGTAPAAGGAPVAPTGTGTAVARDPASPTIGQQANNPGNLSHGVPGSTGFITAADGQKVGVFPDVPTGVAAHAYQLSRYAERGVRTPQDAVNLWVHGTLTPDQGQAARTAPYAAAVAAKLGVKPGDPINLADPAVQKAFILAQQPYESGRSWLNPADVDAGVALASSPNFGKGVAARTGGVNVAGPGAPTGAPTAPVAPGPGGSVAEQPVNQPLINRLSSIGGVEQPAQAPVAAPAPVAPAPAPAAPTAAPVPALPVPQPPNILQSGFTPQQEARLTALRGNRAVSADEFRKVQDTYMTQNAAAVEKYQADVRAYRADSLAQQDAAAKADKAAREAAAAAKAEADTLQGKSEDERITRTLLDIAPKIKDGTATEREIAQYDLLWNQYREGPEREVPDGKGGTFRTRVPREVPARFPPPPGQTVTAGPKPIPGTEKPPDFAPATVVGGMLGNATGQSKLVKALANLTTQSSSVGFIANTPEWLLQRADPEGVQLRSDISDIAGHQFHDLSGAAISPSEAARLKFIPSEHDTAAALKTKMERMLAENRETMLQSYRTYGPENGGRKMPAVEEAIIDSIPQKAIDMLKEKPDTARDFDKAYGKGAAKLVLNNG
jgi:hypothetical protein